MTPAANGGGQGGPGGCGVVGLVGPGGMAGREWPGGVLCGGPGGGEAGRVGRRVGSSGMGRLQRTFKIYTARMGVYTAE